MPNTKMEHWQEMKDKAAANIAHITEWAKPSDEDDLKKHVAHVLKHGNCHEAAEALVEAAEFMTACHMLKAHSLPA